LKLKIYIVLTLILLIGILSFPTYGAEKLIKIAVLPFDDGSIQNRWWNSDWKIGENVSDELITALFNTKKFRLIERDQIDQILKEQNMGTNGSLDSKTAAKIGKILGVQYLVMGKVTEFSSESDSSDIALKKGNALAIKTDTSRVVIDARLVDTSSAEIITAISGKGEKKNSTLGLAVNYNVIAFGSDNFKKTDLGLALRDAVNQLAFGLAANTSETPSPDVLTGAVFYAKENTVIINLGTADNIKPGMTFIINHVIENIKDPDTGEIVDQITEPVAEIKVDLIKDKVSTCSITKILNQKYPIAVKDIVAPVTNNVLTQESTSSNDFASYFPMRPGDRWNYNEMIAGLLIPKQLYERISVHAGIPEDGSMCISYYHSDGPNGNTNFCTKREFYTTSEQGIFQVKDIYPNGNITNYNPPLPLLTPNLSSGATWKWQSDNKKSSWSSKVLPSEPMSIQGKTYSAIVIQVEQNFDGKTSHKKFYYVKDIGLVKEVFSELLGTATLELTDFITKQK